MHEYGLLGWQLQRDTTTDWNVENWRQRGRAREEEGASMRETGREGDNGTMEGDR